jgi:hypothetical protein
MRTVVLASECSEKIVATDVGEFAELDHIDDRLPAIETTDVSEVFRRQFRSVGISQQEDDIGIKRQR